MTIAVAEMDAKMSSKFSNFGLDDADCGGSTTCGGSSSRGGTSEADASELDAQEMALKARCPFTFRCSFRFCPLIQKNRLL